MLILVSVSLLFVITKSFDSFDIDNSINTICNQRNWDVHSMRIEVNLSSSNQGQKAAS